MLVSASTEKGLCSNYTEGDQTLSFSSALFMERRMLHDICEAIGRGERAPYQSAVWQTEQSIVLPSGMSQRTGISAASQKSRLNGWPVHERDTGGDVTPQFSGVLNISIGFPLFTEQRNIATAYHVLTEPLIAFLRQEFSIESYLASVKGAFCDGAHNIVVGGKKLAGTAQRWRIVPGVGDQSQKTAVLGHIAILCEGELDGPLHATNTFFEDAGIDRRVDESVHVTIAELAKQKNCLPKTIAHELSAFLNERWTPSL